MIETDLKQKDLERRLPVWKALSDLFLDNQLDRSDFQYIAKRIRESEYSTLQAQDILWDEVFPALADNLRIIAGEWAYFPDDWLQQRILGVLAGTEHALGSYGLITVAQTRQIVSDYWNEVLRFLPGD